MLITEFGLNGSTGNVTEFDRDGNIIWQITGLGNPMDAERLPTGNTIITCMADQKVIEFTPDKEMVWIKGGLALPSDAERLPNGNTLIAQYTNGKVIEIDENYNVKWEVTGLHKPIDVERLENGNTLITETELWPDGRVTEFDSEGNEVWNISNLDGPVDAERFYSDTYGYTTMVTQHVGGSLTEYDMNGSIVWQKKGLAHPQDAERLSNGNTLVVEVGLPGPNRIIEIDPEGLIIWKFEKDLKFPVDVEICSIKSPPTIDIIIPKEGYFHIRDKPLFKLGNRTIVYGPTDIKVNITSEIVVERVEFIINDILKETIYGEKDSYEYRWAPKKCGTYKIKTTVYDNLGQNVSDSIVLFKWRAHPILILTSFLLLSILFGS